MSWLLYPSIFLAISQGILTNRVIDRWDKYDRETISVTRIGYYGEYCENIRRNRINNGALNPLFWGISSEFLAPLAWATYIIGYILAIVMISCVVNGYDHTYFGILISQLILWINSYTYGKMFGYIFVLLTFIIVYSFKFTLIIPVYFLDDLIQGKLKYKDCKTRELVNKSLTLFNITIKDD